MKFRHSLALFALNLFTLVSAQGMISLVLCGAQRGASCLVIVQSWVNLILTSGVDDAPEPTALPALTLPSSAGAAQSCGGCYVVADVADIVFAPDTVTITGVAVVSMPQGLNGTNGTAYTTVSMRSATLDVGQFSYNTEGLITGAYGGAVSLVDSTVITISGATL